MRLVVQRVLALAAVAAAAATHTPAHAQPGYAVELVKDCKDIVVTLEASGRPRTLCRETGKPAQVKEPAKLDRRRVEIRLSDGNPSATVTLQTNKAVDAISEVWIGCYAKLPTPPRVAFASPDMWTNMKNLTSLDIINVGFVDPNVVLEGTKTLAYLKMESTNARNVSLGASNESWLNKVDFQGTKFSTLPMLLYERVYKKLEVQNLDISVSAGSTLQLSSQHFSNLKANALVANLNSSVELVEDCASAADVLKPVLVVCQNRKIATPTVAPPSESNDVVPETPTTKQESSGGSSATMIVLVLLAVVLVGAIGFVFYRRRHQTTNTLSSHASPAVIDGLISHDRSKTLLSSDTKLGAFRLNYKELSLTKQLGQGQLWLGEYATQKVVVSRVLTAKRDEFATQALYAQARLLASVSHANIVRFIGITWVQDTDLGVVAEFMDHGTLQSVLLDATIELTLRQRVQMCLGIANALAYLHAPARRLHLRRLSSRKVLVNDALECKVNLFECVSGGSSTSALALTASSFGAGELACVAPEQLAQSSSWDPQAANVFAMGVLMSEVLTRRTAYQDESEAKGFTLSDVALRQRMERQEPLLPHENSAAFQALPIALQTLVQRCLSYEISERPSAQEIAEVLESQQQQENQEEENQEEEEQEELV
ncbi:hypothetical protein PINS_up014179 [Pythium insidiosum]|nr:hypothetical protein PINS_up014179 [Pythium insidiosum]